MFGLTNIQKQLKINKFIYFKKNGSEEPLSILFSVLE